MDWLLQRQDRIQKRLAKRHLGEDAQVLYDVSSSYYEGRTCPLMQFGYSRDGKRGRPLALQACPGNTADPSTVPDQVETLRQRFELQRLVLVGNRGMLTDTRSSTSPLGFRPASRASLCRGPPASPRGFPPPGPGSTAGSQRGWGRSGLPACAAAAGQVRSSRRSRTRPGGPCRSDKLAQRGRLQGVPPGLRMRPLGLSAILPHQPQPLADEQRRLEFVALVSLLLISFCNPIETAVAALDPPPADPRDSMLSDVPLYSR